MVGSAGLLSDSRSRSRPIFRDIISGRLGGVLLIGLVNSGHTSMPMIGIRKTISTRRLNMKNTLPIILTVQREIGFQIFGMCNCPDVLGVCPRRRNKIVGLHELAKKSTGSCDYSAGCTF